MWLGLKLLAKGVFEGALKGLADALAWILRDGRHLALSATGLALAWLLLVSIPSLRGDLARARAALAAEQAAHQGTVDAFRAASTEAQRRAEANVARVRAEQEEISGAIISDYRRRLAAVSARFERLRARPAGAGVDPGRADPTGLSAPPASPDRAARAPGDLDLPPPRGLSCPYGLVCLTLEQAERASADALRHDALIDWVIAQARIESSPAEKH